MIIVFKIWIIIFGIGISRGDNNTCTSSIDEVLRFCEPAILDNKSHVYLDFTSFNKNSLGTCSCLLAAKPGTKMYFIAHGPLSMPGENCGVNILVEEETKNIRLGCFSSDLSWVIQATELNISIYKEPFVTMRNADYACYSVYSDDNSSFRMECDGEKPITSSTTAAALIPSTATDSTAKTDTTQTIPPSNRSDLVVKKSSVVDVTSWNIAIPVVASIFIILIIASTIPIVMHFRYRRKEQQQMNHMQRIQAGLKVYHDVGSHTENPLYTVDEFNQKYKRRISEGVCHYASAELRTSDTSRTDEKGMKQLDSRPKFSKDDHHPPADFVFSKNSDKDKQQNDGSVSVPIYAVVEKHKKPREDNDSTDDFGTSNLSNICKSSSEGQRQEINDEHTSPVPVNAVPDKPKKKMENGLRKSVISVSSEGSKTEYF